MKNLALFYFLLLLIPVSFAQETTKTKNNYTLSVQGHISTPFYAINSVKSANIWSYKNKSHTPSYLVHLKLKSKKGWFVMLGLYHTKQTFSLDTTGKFPFGPPSGPLVLDKSFTYIDYSLLTGKEFALTKRFGAEVSGGITKGNLIKGRNTLWGITTDPTYAKDYDEQFKPSPLSITVGTGAIYRLNPHLSLKLNCMYRMYGAIDAYYQFINDDDKKTTLFYHKKLSYGIGLEYNFPNKKDN
ncbi:MAG: hypothetical protein WC150_03395 [Bacteroidia bacterium]